MLAVERHGPAALLAQLERQESEYRRYLALVQTEPPPDSSVTRRLVQDAAIGVAEAHLRWLTRCRDLLRAEPPSRLAIGREGSTYGAARNRDAATGDADADEPQAAIADGARRG